jgi:hypothetical protein
MGSRCRFQLSVGPWGSPVPLPFATATRCMRAVFREEEPKVALPSILYPGVVHQWMVLDPQEREGGHGSE